MGSVNLPEAQGGRSRPTPVDRFMPLHDRSKLTLEKGIDHAALTSGCSWARPRRVAIQDSMTRRARRITTAHLQRF